MSKSFGYLMISMTPFFCQSNTWRTRGLAVTGMPDLVGTGMGASTRLRTWRRFHATSNRGVNDLTAAVAPQLFEGDVSADGTVAEMTKFLTSERITNEGLTRTKEYNPIFASTNMLLRDHYVWSSHKR